MPEAEMSIRLIHVDQRESLDYPTNVTQGPKTSRL